MPLLGGRRGALGSLWAGVVLLGAGSCSRTGFDDLGVVAAEAVPEAGVDAAVVPTQPPPVKPPPECVPKEETCNGADDDCDGQVDEDQVPIPCPNGGERYCVAGRYSACPTRCEVCVPGSERVCFLSYCRYWGSERCAADGRSFGVCREEGVPPECDSVATAHKDSPELEQCCIDNGYCCHDDFDLDHDGVRKEMLGTCDEVACTQ